jgi:hypothetical protein
MTNVPSVVSGFVDFLNSNMAEKDRVTFVSEYVLRDRMFSFGRWERRKVLYLPRLNPLQLGRGIERVANVWHRTEKFKPEGAGYDEVRIAVLREITLKGGVVCPQEMRARRIYPDYCLFKSNRSNPGLTYENGLWRFA